MSGEATEYNVVPKSEPVSPYCIQDDVLNII